MKGGSNITRQFHRVGFFVALLLHILLSINNVRAYNWNYWPDVYTGRHFDHLVTEASYGSTRATRITFLILYRGSCAAQVEALFDQPHMPYPQYVTMIKYNADESEKYIWYDFDAEDDLTRRFNYTGEQCPLVLYFREGGDIRHPIRLSPDDALTESFIWKSLLVTIRIVNTVKESVTVKFFADGPTLNPVKIAEGQEKKVPVYRSYILAAFKDRDGTFIFGKSIKGTSDVVISDGNSPDSFSVWAGIETEKEKQSAYQIVDRKKSYAVVYLMTFKQPPLLPKFNEDMLGYKKMKMPLSVYDGVLNFYQKNRNATLGSELYDSRPFVNTDEVPTHMVQLSEDLQLAVARILHPVVEKWAGCPLTYTTLYGVREYYHGSTLMLHTDHVQTHVVSIIMQIAQDLGDGEPWPLEIIDFNGKRKNLTLEAGEMLLYESATLPHGRPYPFQGVFFANAFLHFRPTNGWMFGLDYRGDMINGTMVKEPYDELASKNIDKSNPQRNIMYRWTELPQMREEL